MARQRAVSGPVVRRRSAIHAVATPPGFEGFAVRFRLLAVDDALLSVKELGELRDVVPRGMGRGDGVYPPLELRRDVQLHPEVPGLPLARLPHFRIPGVRCVLGSNSGLR